MSDFQGMAEVFSQNGNLLLEIRWDSVYDANASGSTAPPRNGALPPNCVPEKQDLKNQISPFALK
jgi:hypothetical protein